MAGPACGCHFGWSQACQSAAASLHSHPFFGHEVGLPNFDGASARCHSMSKIVAEAFEHGTPCSQTCSLFGPPKPQLMSSR